MRTLSAKGGIKHHRATMARMSVVLPMHKSIATLDVKDDTKMVDMSALISSFRPRSKLSVLVTRVVNFFKLFV